jgi:proteic killer suppression protein
MIRSFRSKALRLFATTGDASKLSMPNVDRVRMILKLLDAAQRPDQMNIPGLWFHPLKGRLKGRYAVEASRMFRITFGWDGKDAIDVDLEDYH